MEAITDRIKDSQSRLLEQSLAFVKHTRGAGDELFSRTVDAGGSFATEARGAGELFVSQTREAGEDLVAIVQSEVDTWVAYLKAQELPELPAKLTELPDAISAPELPAKLSAAEIERQILEAVRQALASIESQVEGLEGRIDGRLQSLKKPASLPKPKKAQPAKAKAGSAKKPKAKSNGAAKAPFRGYDEMTAKEVATRVARVNDEKAKAVLSYEKSHKKRATVVRAAKQRISAA